MGTGTGNEHLNRSDTGESRLPQSQVPLAGGSRLLKLVSIWIENRFFDGSPLKVTAHGTSDGVILILCIGGSSFPNDTPLLCGRPNKPWLFTGRTARQCTEAKTIPEAVRQFQQAALPHVSAIVKALGVPFNNNKAWKESKGTAGQWYRSDERDRVHFVMPVPLLKGH